MSRLPVLLPLALGLGLTGCAERRPRFDVDPHSVTRFDVADWAQVLQRFVDEHGHVDYADLRREPEALERFTSLIASVGPTTRPDLFPDEASRLAYYLDAYNALVLREVVRRPGLRSVDDEALSFFRLTRMRVDGESLSLHALENDVIRERFHEPRVHFALNCASLGCPRLRREPWSTGDLETKLAAATQEFLHEERNVAVEDGVIVLSQIFEWYGEDFEPDPVAWIRRHAPDLDLPEGAPVRFRPWDWSLNDQRRRER